MPWAGPHLQHHEANVYQWCQIINVEDILKQQILESLEKKYFKGQQQSYINYANHTLAGLIQHLHEDHGTISPMDIEESDQNMKEEWSLLDPMVDLFEKIKEGVDFEESANIPIPGGKVVNTAYLLILSTVVGGPAQFWEKFKNQPKITKLGIIVEPAV